MNLWIGAGVFGAGIIAGMYIMTELYANMEMVRRHERKQADKRDRRTRRQMDEMMDELANKSALLLHMQNERLYERAWAEGYEAGRRDARSGIGARGRRA